ncbi:ester cyclase [Nannocystaceae bacterium ST9]
MTTSPLLEVWQTHTYAEFALRDVDLALSTMTEDPYVLCVPVGKGGYGVAGVRRFYSEEFFVGMAKDTQITPVAQTIAESTLVDESVVSFTHDVPMTWLLPGIAPTGRVIEFAMIAVISFRAGKIASERLYWDQASLLVQSGVIDPATPSVRGADAVRLLLDPSKLG